MRMKRLVALLISILILAFFCSCANSSNNNNNDVSESLITSNGNESSISEPQPLEVTVSAKNTTTNGKPVFRITSNLPDRTELLLTLENASGFTAQDKITLQNGQGKSSTFSAQGNSLSGTYTLSVTMGMPSLQDQAVQDVIGSRGEYLTGNLIKEYNMGDGTYNSIKAEFTFNIEPDKSVDIEAPKDLIDYSDYPSVLDFGAYSGITGECQSGKYFIYNDYNKAILQDYITEMKTRGYLYGTYMMSGDEYILLGNPQYILIISESDDFVIIGILENDGTFDGFLDSSDKSTQIQDYNNSTSYSSYVTMGESNALESAKQYLSIMSFSYSGLIEQLEYEGYSNSEATYAADNCGANWYEQAVLSAKEYLDVMSFSRQGLIEQLEYEGFTYDQAVYGVEQCGY